MSKFTSAKRINTRWRGNDFVGAPGSSHTFPNELHDEFLVDWAYPIQIGDITITETPTTGNIQVSTLTVGDIVLTGTATGNFGTGSTVVQGTAPISISTTSNTSTVSLNASYSTSTHLHDSDYVNVGGDTMSGQLLVSSATTTSTIGFGEIVVAKGTSYGSITVNATDDHLHLRSKNPIEVLEQSGPTMQGLRARGLGVNSSHTYPTLVDDGITFGEDVNLYRVSANALKTDDALEVVGSLTNGGTAVSLSTHTHAYQPAGSYASSVHAHATSDVTSGNFVATLAAGTGVTVTGADANAAAKTVAIGQAVATNSNVTFNQITASDYIKLSSWNQATDGNDAAADTVTVTTAGTYYAIGGANCEVSFTPDFVGQQFFVTITGYVSLNTTVVQYAFVRVTLTDSSNTLVDTLGYGRADNFGTTGRGGTVAFNQIWTADTTSARKIKLYGTTQTTNGLVLSLAYWQINVMALA